MRDHKREAARRASLLLVITGWCVALVLYSCTGMEELATEAEQWSAKQTKERAAREQKLAAERLLIVGEWTRPGETIEFRGDGTMIVKDRDKLGRVRTVFLSYWLEREGQITLKTRILGGKEDFKRGDVRISADELYLKLWGGWEERVYYRVHR